MGAPSLPFLSKTGPRTSSSTSSTSKDNAPSQPPPALQRLRREDCRLPSAQEKLFSHWKVLVGPTDWPNHAAGVEGADKYRLHNLPSYLGPGVYELGLCHIECSRHSTRSSSHPRKDDIVIVYLGQAENVRTRLQHYGRCGSHLEGGVDIAHSSISGEIQQANSDAIDKALDSSCAVTDKQEKCCLRLFTKAFSQGFSIVFRWTALESKSDAEAVEMGLLKIFDYAWNRGNNGKRRPYVEFETLQKHMAMFSVIRAHIFSSADKWSSPLKWRFTQTGGGMTRTSGFKGKKAVITILQDKFKKLRKKSTRTSDNDKERKLYKELQFLPWKTQSEQEKTSQKIKICGVTVTQGVVCTIAPKRGRKRCESHRGMRISGSKTSSAVIKKCTITHAHAVRIGSKDPVSKVGDANLSVYCGYLMENGSRCMVMPEKGRKRCTLHKGRHAKMTLNFTLLGS